MSHRHHRTFGTRPKAVCCSDGPLAGEPNLRHRMIGFAALGATHLGCYKRWGQWMGTSKMLVLLWFLNCHKLPRRLIEFVPTLRRLPALPAGVTKSSADDHHDELGGRAEVVFAGSIDRPMGN